jgi:hypothetical protein
MLRFRAAACGVVIAMAAAGCEDVPLVPRWDADWYVPLPSDSIYLSSGFPVGVPIPPGTSADVNFDPQTQSLDDTAGELLRRLRETARIIFTVSKPPALAFSGVDTLFVAANQADLTNPASSRIVVPFVIAASAASVTDTVTIPTAGINMLRAVANARGVLWIQMRGRATYEGSGPATISSTDAIGVRLALLARIGISTD